MTVKELWDVTTCELVLQKQAADGLSVRVPLPMGGRLQLEHAEMTVRRITPVKRASMSPYLLIEAEARAAEGNTLSGAARHLPLEGKAGEEAEA